MSMMEKIRREPTVEAGGKERDQEASLRPDQLGSWYLKQAMDFERSKVAAVEASRNLAWKCAGGLAALQALTIITTAVLLFVNKPNPPGVLEKHTDGSVTMLKILADGKITYGRATDIYYLRQYVHYRESYDWETIQDYYNATLLLSNAREGGLYAAFNSENNKISPVNVLKDRFRVIATGGTVSFVGKTALVSFSKKTIPFNGEKPVMEYFVATVAFEYENAPMDDKDRGINVPGFKVTSYHVDRDITKNAAVASGEGRTP